MRKTKTELTAVLITGHVLTQADVQNILDSVHPDCKVYEANLTQSGTSAPTATVLKNQLSDTPTFGYTSTGIFTILGTALFTGTVSLEIDGINGFVYAVVTDVNTITINTKNTSGVLANALLSATKITIKIWD